MGIFEKAVERLCEDEPQDEWIPFQMRLLQAALGGCSAAEMQETYKRMGEHRTPLEIAKRSGNC
jgi:uncharacterized OsmC-like protein